MKSCVIFFIILTGFLFGCKRELQTPTQPTEDNRQSEVTIEGTVFYFVGGGTVEMPFPEGFQLINCKWISPIAESDSGFSVYISGNIDSSYINKRIKALGTIDTIRLYGILPSYVSSYERLNISTFQVVNW